MCVYYDIIIFTHTHTLSHPHHTHTQVLLVFVISSVLVLTYGAELKQKTTYEDTVEAVCGPVVKLAAEVCLLAFCFGSNIAYLVIVGDQLVDSKCGGQLVDSKCGRPTSGQ